MGRLVRLGVVPEGGDDDGQKKHQSAEDINVLCVFIRSDDRGGYWSCADGGCGCLVHGRLLLVVVPGCPARWLMIDESREARLLRDRLVDAHLLPAELPAVGQGVEQGGGQANERG